MNKNKEDKLLSFLKRECQYGKYQLVDKQDLLACFENGEYVDEGELENKLSALEKQGLIKIKYEDENVYCLSLTRENCEEKREKQKLSLSLLYLFTFLFAFLGGMIGAIIASTF